MAVRSQDLADPYCGARSPLARACLAIALLLSAASPGLADERQISALGRLEPGRGVVRVASPSVGGAVIASLAIEEGDRVALGQLLATLDDHVLHAAESDRLRAELANAKREEKRTLSLSRNSVTSQAALDAAELAVRVAEANLAAAEARLSLSEIRAPIEGQILEIHTRPGERVGDDGVLEMGDTKNMMAVAEVYETDIRAVNTGQRAQIRSAAFDGPLGGVVKRVGLKVGRMDVVGADPVAKTDARVVEVRIALDSSEAVERLTNLQVEVEIQP
jgi:HlyD family secretion protein